MCGYGQRNSREIVIILLLLTINTLATSVSREVISTVRIWSLIVVGICIILGRGRAVIVGRCDVGIFWWRLSLSINSNEPIVNRGTIRLHTKH